LVHTNTTGACDRSPPPTTARRRACDVRSAHFHADPFDGIVRIAKTRGVHQSQGNRGRVDHRFDRVARGAGNRGDDRAIFAEERVEQRRLADVRGAREHHQGPFANELSGARRRQQSAERVDEPVGCLTDARGGDRPVILFGKIDVVRDQRLEPDDLIAEREHAAAEASVELAERRMLCRARARAHEIAGGFRLQDVEFAVEHGASREFSR
jgi:hypothetical protein